ncbi:hypothetical protein [Aquamicrobium sp.]|uniref:hypothetical protein n=1 Tax=Aquamicrobium sp. TaxID=1872579 RepID=UPI00258E8F0A|nr:hypothetical protein [Aquamicrobium sp.]MCK9549495.1 hypothetical protein [Aquamicrobium sp.]
MIDFSRLGRMTPEERAARDTERQQAEIDADKKRRAEWSKESFTARLVENVELRATRTGDHVAILRCIGEDGRAFTANYWLPPYMPKMRGFLFQFFREGDTIHLAGYWKKRAWYDRAGAPRAATEFQAQTVSWVSPPEAPPRRRLGAGRFP